MKKINRSLSVCLVGIILVVCFASMLVTGCSKIDNTTQNTAVGAVNTAPTTEELENRIGFEAQYIRTGGSNRYASYPAVKIIRSVEQLNAYYNTYKDKYYLERKDSGASNTAIGFLDACDRYDEAYFEDQILIMVLFEVGSGSITHRINAVCYDDNGQCSIYIESIVPNVLTCDMAQWHILIEPELGIDIDDESKINVVFDNVSKASRVAYGELWLDKTTASNYVNDNGMFSTVEITEIYFDCFFARSALSESYVIKINGRVPDDYCVGDRVYCTYENMYYDDENGRIEADMLTIESSDEVMDEKPVIYLYPEEEMEVSVTLTFDGRLTCTYPYYNNGWTVTASSDGTLTDSNGQTYNYLYWEGKTYTQYDLSKGFCVKGEDTAAFLEDALDKLGLTRREANEFIVYWLPLMEQNPYNIITFQTDIYTDAAKLEIDPAPDTLIRVFMAWQAVDNFVELPEQELSAPERIGFTVVEWGGANIK